MSMRLLNPDEIEVKVKQVSEKGAVALLYKTARVDMAILDETFGADSWTDDYKEIKGNLYCGIGVRGNIGEDFVWKWNCGTESREDGDGNEKKGEASDAFKRAGFLWGIGRELYTAPFIFLKLETQADGKKFVLKDRYARFSVKEIEYEDKRIKKVVIIDQNGKEVFPRSNYKKTDVDEEPIKPAPTKTSSTVKTTAVDPIDVFNMDGAETADNKTLFVNALKIGGKTMTQGKALLDSLYGETADLPKLTKIELHRLIAGIADIK